MLFTEMTEEEARDLAREDGYERGRRDGQAEGRQQGRQEGTSIGDANARCDIARNLKTKDMSPEEIMEVTGLTLEEVLAL